MALAFATACGEGPSSVKENLPPTVTVVTPLAGALFSGGDQIPVEISGLDDQDGTLEGGALSWWVILHHDTHVHPYLPPSNGADGQVSVQRTGHVDTDIFLRLYARAEDSEGLADTTWVDVAPRLVSLDLVTEPAGLLVTVEGQPRTAPATVGSVVGMERELGAPSPQTHDGLVYEFSSWSQGGGADQILVAPADGVTLTATFTSTGRANEPPTVSISEPSTGATVTLGQVVSLAAETADVDGAVVGVQFLDGTTVLGSDDTAPFGIEWTPGATGSRTLTARATDDEGAITTSAPVTVFVQAPGGGDVSPPNATLTTPVQGTLGLNGSVALTATASDDVGVTLVEFQVDGEALATDATAPYTATLPTTADFASGAHTFRARARDAAGNWSAWSASTVTFGGAVELPAGFTRTTVASGFTSDFSTGFLTAAAFAPDGRLFVLEQRGRVHVIKDGALLATPFLDLPAALSGERGLLGIAFHPDFETNQQVYLYYTTEEGGTARNRISRFTADGDVAQAGSEEILVELDQLSGLFHNGGAMEFGPDGMLYVAVGDNVQTGTSQSLTSRFGKILRYHPDGTIPADNPFAGSTSGPYRAIWAMGLRNPYTFAFRPGTGRMHINDVGEGAWEEINLGIAGGNYGWPATEGPTSNPAYESPILAYAPHGSPTLYSGFAIVGAAFYDPPVNTFGEAYTGDYFFADYVGGWIYRMDGGDWDTAYAFAQLGTAITNLLVGPDGALYVLSGSQVERIAR